LLVRSALLEVSTGNADILKSWPPSANLSHSCHCVLSSLGGFGVPRVSAPPSLQPFIANVLAKMLEPSFQPQLESWTIVKVPIFRDLGLYRVCSRLVEKLLLPLGLEFSMQRL
jgi:hypothetical protein